MKTFLLAAILTLSACEKMGAPESAGEQSSRKYTDAEAAAIFLAIGDALVDDARLASERASNESVKRLASTIEQDHRLLVRRVRDHLADERITPTDSVRMGTLNAEFEADRQSLRLSGRGFDEMFVKQMVKDHDQALKILNEDVIPSTRDPELRRMMQDAVDLERQHLDRARALQARPIG